jgi:hypothetical protein
MTIEYVVLGAILILMGVIQTWLRHGPEGRRLRAEQARLADRLVDAADADAQREAALKAAKRSGRAWNSWTAILGGVGIAFGIVLVVLGVLGR